MLRRKMYDRLLEWKNNRGNECLLVKGARQIGKTFIIDQFGRENYSNYIYINFIQQPEYLDAFEGNLTLDEIMMRLSLILPNIKLEKGNTLLFLDEIQNCPNARTALKFLAESRDIDVIASGSLLGIHYKGITSIPVGYEKQIVMYGLDFEEYLWAVGYSSEAIRGLEDYLKGKKKIPSVVHEQMVQRFREYMVVGGMPAVVQRFVDTHHFGEVHNVQTLILDSYMDDILKYASTTEKPKVRNCYLSIPRQLSKENTKFQFSVVEKKSTARKYENSIEWLRDAGLVYLCNAVSIPLFPLIAYEKPGFYRMYMADTGLLIALYGYEMKKAILDDSIKGPAKGGIYENVIASMLIQRGYKPYYYMSESGDVEIDFLITGSDGIIPVEVKSNRGSSTSLNRLLEQYEIQDGYKLTSGNIGILGKKLTLPWYMTIFL